MSTPDEPSSPDPAPTYRTPSVPVEPEELPAAPVVNAPVVKVPVVKVPRALLLIPVVVVLVVLVAVVGAIVGLSGGEGDDSASSSEEVAGDVLTAQGYDELVAAVEDASGSTWVFDAVLYPAYAVVSLPVDSSSQREESWYWDGDDLRSNDNKGTASGSRIDLTRVSGDVVVDLVDQVRTLVEDPTSWYVIVRAPDHDRAMIWAYANNEYSETAYLGARRDGTVVYDSTEH